MQIEILYDNGCQDEPDNGRRSSTTWYVDEYKKEEEEEEEDGGDVSFTQLFAPTHSQVRDFSSAQSEVCNIFQYILF